MAIDGNGQLYAWGSNAYGRTGNATNSGRLDVPTKLTTAAGIKFRQVNAGDFYSLGIDYEGNVYTWGVGLYGNHSYGSPAADYYVPKRMVISGNPKIVKVCNTRGTSLALDSEGNIWAWGTADSAIMGDGATNLTFRSTPERINGFGDAAPFFTDMAVSSGDYPSILALTNEGDIWSWGSDIHGELGLGANTGDNRRPAVVYTASTGMWSATSATGAMRGVTHLTPGTKMVSVAIGWRIGGSMDENGSIYTWGANAQNSLGVGSTAGGNDYPPQRVYNALTGEWAASQTANFGAPRRMVYYHISYSSGYVIDELGNVYSWGRADNGKLGINSTTAQSYPTLVYNALTNKFMGGTELPSGAKIISVSGNRDFVFFMADDGSVFAAGVNAVRQLGDGTDTNRNTVVLISSGISGSAFPSSDLEFPLK